MSAHLDAVRAIAKQTQEANAAEHDAANPPPSGSTLAPEMAAPEEPVDDLPITTMPVEPEVLRLSSDTDLHAMNQRHCVLPISGKTRVLTWKESTVHEGRRTAMFSTFDDFQNLRSNLSKEWVDKAGKPHLMPLGKWWLGCKNRRQYDEGMEFLPHRDGDIPGKVLNLWTGFAREPRRGDCTLFLKHIRDNICSGNGDHYGYLVRWMATIIQKRVRTEIAVMLRSDEEGTGKGYFVKNFGLLFGEHYMQLAKAEHLIGKFNEHLERLLLANADEALFAGDPRHRSALYNLITEPTITVEPKGYTAYAARNFSNIIITSNSKHVIPAGATARRFLALDVASHQVGHPEYFDAIDAELKAGGHEALLHHLMHEIDLSGFDVRAVPKTAALREQQAYSRKGVEGLVEKALSEGVVPCAHYKWRGFSVSKFFDKFIDENPDRHLRDLGSLKVKHRLRKEFKCVSGDAAKRRGKAKAADENLQAIVAGVLWPPLDDMRADFERDNGPQDWLNPDATAWELPVQSSREPGSAGTAQEDNDEIPF
jgi:hypothetical protein